MARQYLQRFLECGARGIATALTLAQRAERVPRVRDAFPRVELTAMRGVELPRELVDRRIEMACGSQHAGTVQMHGDARIAAGALQLRILCRAALSQQPERRVERRTRD